VEDLANKIKNSINKFELDLSNKTVLTEAATGNYVVTPIIAAVAGAKKVFAFTKESKYGTVEEVKSQTYRLAKYLNVENKIEVVTNLNDISLDKVDILTNTGFLRPIDKYIIDKLNSNCTVPLMWETWEFRDSDLDIEACKSRGIKVYGTNEDDKRLKTKEYIGYMVLKFLLEFKHTPLSSTILVLGCDYFTKYVEKVLRQNGYKYRIINEYNQKIDTKEYNAIVLLEHHKRDLLIGESAFIEIGNISKDKDVIHICGEVDFTKAKFNYIPINPAPFGYMSYTADYMGIGVVIDLHTAGLKVAEGMIEANSMNLNENKYKEYMERNYPAMAFKDKRYW